MPILSDSDRQQVQAMLSGMIDPVKLVFFTQTIGCETCAPTKQILDELVPLSDKLSVEEVNFVLDTERAATFGIDHVPAIAMMPPQRVGKHASGAPAMPPQRVGKHASGAPAMPPQRVEKHASGAPAMGAGDSRIRFYGIPSGYEFMSLLDAIMLVSSGAPGLSDTSQALLAKVEAPLKIQVFVTPT